MNQVRKLRQRERKRTTRLIRELHPNQTSYIERVETIAPLPVDLNTYGLKSHLGLALLRLWMFDSRSCLPANEYKLRRASSQPLVDDRDLGLYLL